MYSVTQYPGHGANLMGNSFSIVIGGPQLPGQIYYDEAPQSNRAYPANTPILAPYMFGDESGFEAGFAAPGPFSVIPPGYSLRINSLISQTSSDPIGGLLVCSFWYVVLKDRG